MKGMPTTRRVCRRMQIVTPWYQFRKKTWPTSSVTTCNPFLGTAPRRSWVQSFMLMSLLMLMCMKIMMSSGYPIERCGLTHACLVLHASHTIGQKTAHGKNPWQKSWQQYTSSCFLWVSVLMDILRHLRADHDFQLLRGAVFTQSPFLKDVPCVASCRRCCCPYRNKCNDTMTAEAWCTFQVPLPTSLRLAAKIIFISVT